MVLLHAPYGVDNMVFLFYVLNAAVLHKCGPCLPIVILFQEESKDSYRLEPS